MKGRSLLAVILLFPGLLLGGCSRQAGVRDRRDEEHPLMRKALAAKRANDIDRAISAFQAALEKRSNLARAHLELGLLYDEHQRDYLRAVYHYERYLEMRPDAGKRQYIESMIQIARISYAASFPDHSSEAIRRVRHLEQENRTLRAALDEAIEENRGLRVRPAIPSAAAPSLLAPAAPQRAAVANPTPAAERTVTVERGDTLSSIAARVYGNPSQWRRIYDANRNLLRSPGDVRPGQTLILPPDVERSATR